ncbi:FAD-binding oxidoreductase [Halorubellus sp. PRR65]|uniref:ferredoxin--NADP reductase n=1 Tax=Halorubellus sp. PRR65 TaxID=3098148 RepID=UPI002B25B012|nr:FAD-binding oxidoreductase [Halorubellus sp. PRR65]
MDVPEHLGHREAAEALPLVTESAVVTEVAAMDENRTEAVEGALEALFARNGVGDWYRDPAGEDGEGLQGADVDWDRVESRARDAGFPSDDLDALSDLVARYERPYPSLLRVRVRIEDDVPLDFAPGQYATVTFDGHPRPYSIASSPTADELEFCIRRVPGGTLTSDVFQSLEVGDEVTVRGPNGELVLGDPSERDVAFLATGTGVAPFKSMLDYVYETDRHVVDGHERDVWLFLGAAYEDDLAYREAFRELDREHDGFHFVPTLTRERHLGEWTGETAYVQRVLLEYVAEDAVDASALPTALREYASATPALDVDTRIDPGNVDVYACGVTAMVDQLVAATRAIGVPDDRTRFEGFG